MTRLPNVPLCIPGEDHPVLLDFFLKVHPNRETAMYHLRLAFSRSTRLVGTRPYDAVAALKRENRSITLRRTDLLNPLLPATGSKVRHDGDLTNGKP